jgi:hypothetical protein
MTTKLTGGELVKDLAKFLSTGGQWMVWTQLPLGSVWFHQPGIVDVLAILKSWTNTSVRIYEVKVSRSDFLADVNKGKYERYLDCCTQFYFAAPSGLIQKTELPKGCGLITRSDDRGWHVAKAGSRRDFKWDAMVLLKLLMRSFEDHFPRMRELSRNRFENDQELLYLAKGRGAELAKRLGSAEDYIKQIEELKNQIDAALGQNHNSLTDAMWRLRDEVKCLLAKRLYSEEAVALARITMDLFNGQHLARNYTARTLREMADRLEEIPQKV